MAYTGIAGNMQVLKSITVGYAFKDREEVVTNSSTGNYSMASTQQKAVIVHTAAGNAVYQLPTAVAGKQFTFIHKGDTPSSFALNEMQIQPASGDEISFGNNLSINPGYLSFFKRGTQICMIAIDSTTWEVLSFTVNENMKNSNRSDSQPDYKFIGKDAWSSKGAATVARDVLKGFNLVGYGYNVGGATALTTSSAVTEQYNDSTDAWTAKTSLNTARRGLTAFSLNDFGYATHGLDIAVLNSVERYNYTANTWTNLSGTSGTARSSASEFTLNGYGYASSVVGVVSNGVKFNQTTDSWSTIAAMSTDRIYSAGCSAHGYGYIMGGADATETTFYSSIEQYNDSANTFLTRASFTTARDRLHGISLNESIFIFGGNTGSTIATNYQYDEFLNSWSSKTSISANRNAGSYFSLNGYGYQSCGTDGTTRQTTSYNYN